MSAPLKKPALRRIRGLKMLEMYLEGRSRSEIAKRFRVSTRTVINEMDFLEKEGLLKKTEDTILTDLFPLALEVLKNHLEEQKGKTTGIDIEGAKTVLREPLKRAGQQKREDPDELTLEKWVISRKVQHHAPIEGSVVSSRLLLDSAPEDGGRAGEGDHDDQRENGRGVRVRRAEGKSEAGSDR
jgi:hypothetical protein